MNNKKRIFSGIQPSGNLHIGNYIGAILLWKQNLDAYENMFCIVDLHSLTIPDHIKSLRLKTVTRSTAALYIACGISPEKSDIFIQSHVKEHAELAWILNCFTPEGWLKKMVQYKSKSKINSSNMGLFDYPVLQAADILLYNTDSVPVGDDQKQHIELCRNIAERFNHMISPVFKIPEVLVRESGSRIMALNNPEEKMSKSNLEKGHAIFLTDTADIVKKTISTAKTDSGSEVNFDSLSKGLENLIVIYENMANQTREHSIEKFEGKNYGFLKREITEAIVSALTPIQDEYHRIHSDISYIDKVLKQGAENVSKIAISTMKQVKEALEIG